MAQQQLANFALLIVIAFALMALAACVHHDQTAAPAMPTDIASVVAPPAIPEFHGASIGNDALRSRLESEA